MWHHSQGRLEHQVDCMRQQEADGAGLPFADLLCPHDVQRVIDQEGGGVRACIFSPAVTLYAFLAQVLSKDHSCRKAVARLLAWWIARGCKSCSPDTGPYCKARARLPERVPAELARQVGADLQRRVACDSLLGGRPIKIVDGTTVSMPDTPSNQQAYPQAKTQKPGLGFPIARLCALISLQCGAVLDMVIGPYQGKQTGETALFRCMWDHLHRGDIVLGDRYFCSFWHIAMLCQRGVDVIFRLHHLRDCDFRRGQRLGKYDQLVQWFKPKQRPDWMDAQTYAQLPDVIEVRQVKVTVNVRGFRVKSLVLVTTLTDPIAVPRDALAEVYRARWHAELDLRSIKCAMQMDVLRCKSPAMVRKEIWMHLLAYNLIRTVMAQAAQSHGVPPRQISFTGSMQTLEAFADVIRFADADDWPRLYRAMLQAIAHHRVGHRPDRHEPRAVKRRPKPHPLLTVPRKQAQCRLTTTT